MSCSDFRNFDALTSAFAHSRTGRPAPLRPVAAVRVMTLFKPHVCVLHGSPCAPLVYPWLGEVEGASLAMPQAKASPVPALAPMFRVSPVLRRLPSAVSLAVVRACGAYLPFANRLELCVQTSRWHSLIRALVGKSALLKSHRDGPNGIGVRRRAQYKV